MDFYIASRLGELIGNRYEGAIVIVSNDSGFQAVREYWEKRAIYKRKILISSCIEDGIVGGNENDERAIMLRHLREKISIGGYHSAYTEKMRVKRVLEKLFKETEYEGRIEEIQNMIAGKSPKLIYLSSLHMFGKKSGLEIYNRIKSSPLHETA